MTATPQSAETPRHPRRRHTQVLRQHLDLAGKRIADVGCGDGAFARYLVRQGAQAFGLEIDLPQLRRALDHQETPRPGPARPTATPPGNEPPQPPSYLCARGEALPFAEAALDVVVFFNSLHHIPVTRQSDALAEAARVLKPGGQLVAIEPLAEGPTHRLSAPVEDETDVRARAYEAIARALESGALESVTEETYEAPSRTASFQSWKEEMIAVDPARRPAVAAASADPAWERQFLALAEPTPDAEGAGYRLWYPTRLNLLRKPS